MGIKNSFIACIVLSTDKLYDSFEVFNSSSEIDSSGKESTIISDLNSTLTSKAKNIIIFDNQHIPG